MGDRADEREGEVETEERVGERATEEEDNMK